MHCRHIAPAATCLQIKPSEHKVAGHKAVTEQFPARGSLSTSQGTAAASPRLWRGHQNPGLHPLSWSLSPAALLGYLTCSGRHSLKCVHTGFAQEQQEVLQLRTALAQSHTQQKEDEALREQLQANLSQLHAEHKRASLQVCPYCVLLAWNCCSHALHDCSCADRRRFVCHHAAEHLHVRMRVPICLWQGRVCLICPVEVQVQQERSRAVSAEARSNALAEELTTTCADRDAAQASLCAPPSEASSSRALHASVPLAVAICMQ